MKFLYIAFSVLLIILFVRVFNKYKRITLPKSHTEIDSLDIMLSDIKTKLPPGTAIGFATNTPTHRSLVLYFKTALVLAPIVVEFAESDTMILIQERRLPDLSKNSYTCIRSGGSKDLKYDLVYNKR